MNGDPGTWIAAVLTVITWSYLYKQNRIFQIAEHLFVGISAAHAMTVAFTNVRSGCVTPFLEGDRSMLIPLVGGLLLYARFAPRLAHLSRIPLGFTMGTAAAVAIRGALGPSFIQQVRGTVIPLNSVDDIILVGGTVATLAYFLFGTKSRTGALAYAATLGRYTMMAAFGAAYGNTVMMRMSLLIPRIKLVFGTWLGLLP
ncbi:MAG: hypothetical protein ACOX5M_07820 [Bacillota bacterium]